LISNLARENQNKLFISKPHTPAVQSPLFMIYFIKKRKEIMPTRPRIDMVGYHQKAIFINIKNAKSGD